jgi:Domain of unknown function (DUF4159)
MKSHLLLALALTLTLTTLLPAQPQGGSEEPLADQVRKAIDRGVTFLKNEQQPNGSWPDYIPTKQHPGATTAMAILALLNCGVPANDPRIVKGLEYLRTVKDQSTYARALQTMAFAEAGHPADAERIKQNVDHFLKVGRDKSGAIQGWHYDYSGNGSGGTPDNSNTQYALLAVWMARQSGIKVEEDFWKQVRAYYANPANWAYSRNGGGAFESGRTLTMAVAAMCGLCMAEMELNAANKDLDPVKICGQYDDDGPLSVGLAWIGKALAVDPDARPTLHGRAFYNLYGLERLGRLSGLRFLGAHDWYREGCAWLVKKQNSKEGYWEGANIEHMKIVSTSYALLFLSKGRTPVLMSKLAHGNLPRVDRENQDWNRRRNDLRHLVEFASKEVFKKMPLAWQNFDILQTGETGTLKITPQREVEITSDLLQSPIVYITGHGNPNKQLKPVEKSILKKYVESGGFILGVACCGSKDFDKGFHELCEELFDKELQPLDPNHPVWTMKFEVKPDSFDFKLKGLQLGCKTVVIYCPENMCGYWELDRKDDRGKGEAAFHLGANIIAYATGLEPPKPRLTKMEVTLPVQQDPQAQKRGYFTIGQVISKTDEKAKWTPAPEAMAKLAQKLRDFVGLDVIIKTDLVPIEIENRNFPVTRYKFLYMHGRNEFKFQPKDLEKLRFNLENGGLLFADACCGKEAFDKSFRQFIKDLFPSQAGTDAKEPPQLERIPPDDKLFSKELNGEALAETQVRLERGKAFKASPPLLEGVKINNRWVVIYSKYDIGCALQQHQAGDCLGYSYASALRVGLAAVLYQLRP